MKIKQVFIERKTLHDIFKKARQSRDAERIGVLFGVIEDERILIKSFNYDDSNTSKVHAILDDNFMSKSTQHCIENRPEKIIGWWHTHPTYGCFMSEPDRETQTGLQALGDVIALVIDPSRQLDFRFFYIDKSKETIEMPYYVVENIEHAKMKQKAK